MLLSFNMCVVDIGVGVSVLHSAYVRALIFAFSFSSEDGCTMCSAAVMMLLLVCITFFPEVSFGFRVVGASPVTTGSRVLDIQSWPFYYGAG